MELVRNTYNESKMPNKFEHKHLKTYSLNFNIIYLGRAREREKHILYKVCLYQ